MRARNSRGTKYSREWGRKAGTDRSFPECIYTEQHVTESDVCVRVRVSMRYMYARRMRVHTRVRVPVRVRVRVRVLCVLEFIPCDCVLSILAADN